MIQQKPQWIRNDFTLIFLLIFLFGLIPDVLSYPPLPNDIHYAIQKINDLVYNEEYETAEKEAKKVIRKYPEHPVGYFCMAFIINSWMLHYQSEQKEDEFYNYCDLAIEKGEKFLSKGNKDVWIRFFIGGADGFKGTYEARYERWITALRYGWKGVSVLFELESEGSDIPDIYYGIGYYNYWRSALTKVLWWMPGVEDKREKGIEQLYKAYREGIYTNITSGVTLVDVFLNEKRYSDALTLTNEILKKYPNFTVILKSRAIALFNLHRYDEAEALLKRLIEKTDTANLYDMVLYRYYLAKIFLAEQRYSEIITTYNIIISYQLPFDLKRRVEHWLNELKNLYKESLQRIK
ncbi:MAG: tetratricopeptide repeat protein [Chitinispirillaceae bacterium]|nr:tetratricopeptide repeat protein [Chitinispirillaceae bacterium]